MFTSKLEFLKTLKNKITQLGYPIELNETKGLVDWIESVVTTKYTFANDFKSLSDEDRVKIIRSLFELDYDQSLVEDGYKYRKLKDLINQ